MASDKIKIAILGACCSRDMFNSNFVENWRNSFDLVLYRFQPSIISLMAVPIPYPRWISKNVKQDFFVNMLIDECRKDTLNQLCSVQPEVILVDFYSDVLNGVIAVNNYSYITNREQLNWKNEPMYQMLGTGRKLNVHSYYQEYLMLWKDSFRRFAEYLNKYLPNTRVFINPVKATNEVMDEEKNISMYPYDKKSLDNVNCAWQEMDDYAKSFNNCFLLKLPCNKYYIDRDYIFGGAWIVHFHKIFYRDLFETLCEKSLADFKNDGLPEVRANLILNSDFKMGTLFWRHWDDCFKFSGNFSNMDNVLNFENYDENRKYHQMWCSEIETGGIDSLYELTFECSVPVIDMFEHPTIFEIRTFDKRNLITRAESKEEFKIQLKKDEHVGEEFIKYEFVFHTKEKYISMGPYVYSKGVVRYRNITLVKLNEKDSKKEVLDNPVSNFLLKEEDQMIDVNYYQITNFKQLHNCIIKHI